MSSYLRRTTLAKVQRLWSNVPIYHEIDAFFNYLYHEHPNCPAKKYSDRKARLISDEKRISDLLKYHREFKIWLKTSDWEGTTHRLSKIRIVQNYLSSTNIKKISHNEVEEVALQIHAMTSYQLNKSKFLNLKNNSLSKIRVAWEELIYNENVPIENRMEKCNDKLISFGEASIQELISCYYPKKYPVVNSNSKSGMKFFGYEI